MIRFKNMDEEHELDVKDDSKDETSRARLRKATAKMSRRPATDRFTFHSFLRRIISNLMYFYLWERFSQDSGYTSNCFRGNAKTRSAGSVVGVLRAIALFYDAPVTTFYVNMVRCSGVVL